MRCDAFASPGNPNGPVINRRFSSKEITLSDGFVADAGGGVNWQVRFFLALPSESPCTEVLSIYGVILAGLKQIQEQPVFADSSATIKRSQDEEISVYPTPTSGLVKISCNTRSLAGSQVSVIDQSGRVVHQSSLNNDVYTADINLSHLANGIYFLKVNSLFNSVTKKIVIQK